LSPTTPESNHQDVSINDQGSASNARAGSPKRNPEQNPRSGYWSRISKIAKAIIMELGKNAENGNYYVYKAQPPGNYGESTGESLIEERGYCETTSRIADPYGLITRLKKRTESDSPK